MKLPNLARSHENTMEWPYCLAMMVVIWDRSELRPIRTQTGVVIKNSRKAESQAYM